MNLVVMISTIVLALAVILSAFVVLVRYGSRLDALEKADLEASARESVRQTDVKVFWEKQSLINENLARLAMKLDQYINSSERRLDRLEDFLLRNFKSE